MPNRHRSRQNNRHLFFRIDKGEDMPFGLKTVGISYIISLPNICYLRELMFMSFAGSQVTFP